MKEASFIPIHFRPRRKNVRIGPYGPSIQTPPQTASPVIQRPDG
jgi:hypothetical protein